MTVGNWALILAWVAIAVLTLAVSRLAVDLRAIRGSMDVAQTLSARVAGLGRDLSHLPGVPDVGPAAVLFADGACLTCQEIVPEYVRIGEDYEAPFVVAALDNGDWIRRNPAALLAPMQRPLRDALGILVSPYLLITSDGAVTDGGPIGSIRSLRSHVEGLPKRRSDTAESIR